MNENNTYEKLDVSEVVLKGNYITLNALIGTRNTRDMQSRYSTKKKSQKKNKEPKQNKLALEFLECVVLL